MLKLWPNEQRWPCPSLRPVSFFLLYFVFIYLLISCLLGQLFAAFSHVIGNKNRLFRHILDILTNYFIEEIKLLEIGTHNLFIIYRQFWPFQKQQPCLSHYSLKLLEGQYSLISFFNYPNLTYISLVKLIDFFWF